MINEKDVRGAIDAGIELYANQRSAGKNVRQKTKAAVGDLLDAHCLAVGVIASATGAVSRKPGKTNAAISQILSLTSSFIQGIDICESAISEGFYVSATALLKQEMEAVAAICEVRAKARKSGATPNVKYFGKLAVVYGDLNRVAHVSDTDLMHHLTSIELSETQQGAPLAPVFNEGLAKFLYALHVTLIAQTAIAIDELLHDMYGAGFKDFEKAMLARIAKLLQEAGWLGAGTNSP